MAYVGYDHGWITVTLNLGAFRHPGWLDQFNWRGGRVIEERPLDEQLLRIIGPDDRRFHAWGLMRRADSEHGLKLREERNGPRPGDGVQERLSVIIEAEATDSTAIGMDEEDDLLDPKLYRALCKVRDDFELGGVNLTKFAAFCRQKGFDLSVEMKRMEEARSGKEPPMMDEDYRQILRSMLRKITNQIDGIIRARYPEVEYGWAYDQLNKHFGCRIGDPGISIVMLRDAIQWAKTTLKAEALKWKDRDSG
jgi:hypothetical protein